MITNLSAEDLTDFFRDLDPVAENLAVLDTKTDEDETRRIFDYLLSQGVGATRCRTRIAEDTGIDVAHVSTRIDSGRSMGMAFVGGKRRGHKPGDPWHPLCECCRGVGPDGKVSRGTQIYSLASADIAVVLPRDLGLELTESGDDLKVLVQTHKITERYKPEQVRQLIAMLAETHRKWKQIVSPPPPKPVVVDDGPDFLEQLSAFRR